MLPGIPPRNAGPARGVGVTPRPLEDRLRTTILALIAVLPTLAEAACEDLLAKVQSVDAAELSSLYGEVVACDKAVAGESFGTFMRSASTVDPLVALSLEAIEGEVYKPVWAMMEQIADYQTREAVARKVGSVCKENAGVLPFLQGGYYAMNDRAFSMWSEAFATCDVEEVTTWLKTETANPPPRTYDDKYHSILAATVKRLGPEALKPLESAAIAASERGGPFTTVLEKMQEAVKPKQIGAKLDDSATAQLSAALVRVGNGGVKPEQAALVADRLHQMGSQSEAAALLKVVYSDRAQADGSLLYGVSSVEHCGGEAIVHVAAVREPGKRWNILADVTPLARAFKPRLKCQTEGDWPVQITRAPMKTQAEIDVWAGDIVNAWTEKKLVSKPRSEKTIVLP